MVSARAVGHPVVALIGPTATGKSALAIALAERLPVQVISVDSAMVYRGLDIGTGKPPLAVRQQIPHALVDIRDPAETYSAAAFVADAAGLIRQAHARGRLPLLVGGTMLYAKALRDGIAAMPAADATLRARIAGVRADGGNMALSQWLANIDGHAAARLHVNDTQRLTRALEVALSSGKAMHEHWQQAQRPETDWYWHVLWLAPPRRQALDAAIQHRFAEMLDAGFEAEVAALRARGDLAATLPALRSVGYRQMWAYLDADVRREEMIRQVVAATRALAKRQYTWQRQFPEAIQIEPGHGVLERTLHILQGLSIVGGV